MNWHSQEWQRTSVTKVWWWMLLLTMPTSAKNRVQDWPSHLQRPTLRGGCRRALAALDGRRTRAFCLVGWVKFPALDSHCSETNSSRSKSVYNQSQPFTNSWTLDIAAFWGLPCSILTSSYLIRTGYTLDPRGSLSLPSSNHPRTEASWIRPTFRRKIMPCCRTRSSHLPGLVPVSGLDRRKAREFGMANPLPKDIGCPRLRPASRPNL